MKDTNLNIDDPFFEAKSLLYGLIDVLCTQKWLAAEHGKVEKLIHQDGFEVMRLVLQGHLDQRARQEPDLTLYDMELMNILINARIAHDNSIQYLAR